MTDSAAQREANFMGRCLYVFAAWTLTIKFILPMAWAVHQQEPITTHIWWDAWWVAHLMVGYGLLHRSRHVYVGAWVLAVVEVVIIVAKFILFLPRPVYDFWHVNWFINKSFLLVYFLYTFIWLAKPAIRRLLSYL